MKLKIWEILVDNENECYTKSARHIRIALIAGAIMYSLFGVLDLFMLPETHKAAWLIRFGIIGPVTVAYFFFTYSPSFLKYGKFWLTLLVILAQAGIVTMIYFSQPDEGAYWGYYAGLILVILWAVIMFRLSIPEVVISSLSNVLFYNLLAFGFQKMDRFPLHSMEFGYLINNNFFLISTSFLALLGAYQLNQYKKKLSARNHMLIREKSELKKAKEKAEESDRLKSAFLANMSHEIRTPMNAILGFGELIRDESLSGKKRNEYISIIQSKGHQLMHLINDIIDLSQIETNNISIKTVAVQLNHIFDELEQTYRREIEQRKRDGHIELSFQTAFTSEKSWILADGFRLKQVLSNLVDNAIKFTVSGKIQVGYELFNDNELKFYVLDTGIGIPLEKQKLVFERFRQVHDNHTRPYSGTGLGLSIVKSLVELMGGKVDVKSQPGEGSEFFFLLPYIPVEGPVDNVKPGVLKRYSWKGKVVLIAEDDEDNYYYLKEMVKSTGAAVIWAKDGKETLNTVHHFKHIDLVLMDVKMPEIDGLTVTREIKKMNPEIPVIIQTAYAMEEDRNMAIEAGADNYLSKPIEPDIFFRLLHSYLNK